MDYICHFDYNGMTESGRVMNLKRGETYPIIGQRIANDNRSICVITSEVSHMHFSRNDDGRGLERGDLTYAIAYSHREREDGEGHIFRFSPEEQTALREKWKHWLRNDESVILFNNDFYQAEIEDLKKLADYLQLDIEQITKNKIASATLAPNAPEKKETEEKQKEQENVEEEK